MTYMSKDYVHGRDVVRAARSAPAVSLEVVSGGAASGADSIRDTLRALPERGRCQQVATQLASVAADPDSVSTAQQHRAYPPAAKRSADDCPSRGTMCWAGRGRIGVSAPRALAARLAAAPAVPGPSGVPSLIAQARSEIDHVKTFGATRFMLSREEAYCSGVPPGMLARLVSGGGDAALMASADSACPASSLASCCGTANATMRIVAARNPACPPEVLRALAADDDSTVCQHAMRNPSCPPESLRRVAVECPELLPNFVVRNPRCPPEALRVLHATFIEDSDYYTTMLLLLEHPNCPADVLSACADHEISTYRSNVAKHPRAAEETLLRLADDPEAFVRTNLAVRSDCPASVKKALVNDPEIHIRFLVAEPTPTEPAPAESTPAESTPTEPAPAEPTPAGSRDGWWRRTRRPSRR